MNNYLEHYGVIGMKWGRRKRSSSSQLRLEGPTSSDSSGGYNPSAFKSSGSGKAHNAKYREANGSSSSKSSSNSSFKSSSKSSSDSSSKSSNPKPKDKKNKQHEPTHEPTKPNVKSQKVDTKMAKDGLSAGKKLADAGANKLKKEREDNLDKKLKTDAKEMSNAEMQEIITRLNMEARYVEVMKKNTAPEAKSNLEKTLEVVGQAAAYADTAINVYNTIQDIREKL